MRIRTAALKTQAKSMEQGEKGGAQSLFVLVTPSSPLPPSGGGKKRLCIAASNFPQDAASGDARLSRWSPTAAVDYSEGSMSEARRSLGTVATFIHGAQAYVKGQLQCPPIQEDVLWER